MKHLIRIFIKMISAPSLSRGERYLARSVDAHDLELRIQKLERYRG